jgi:serine/threonine-protein kinase
LAPERIDPISERDVTEDLASLPIGRATVEALVKLGDADLNATLARVGTTDAATEGGRPDTDGTATFRLGVTAGERQRFRVLRPHAKGGLGIVFVALDQDLHREVALKEIQDRHADDPVSRSRFLLEAEITGGLEHPGIVPVYGLGAYGNGRPYYAMRFIRGDSLKEAIEQFHRPQTPTTPFHLAREGRGGGSAALAGSRELAFRKLLRRFLDVCNAIDYAHSRGVLHRDLKPGNIIVGKFGETLVVDWGLAKPLGRTESGPAPEERPLMPASVSGSAQTQPGSALGTPAYMSPEQAQGQLERLSPRSDVYSLGATLYCLLTGKPPFEADDIGTVIRAVQRGEFPPPRDLDPMIDRPLEAVCLKAMAREPEDRYASCEALADDIERWMADEPVSAYPEPWSDRARRWTRRHRTVVVSAGCLLLASVIGLSLGLVMLRAEQDRTEAARSEAVQNYQNTLVARKAADTARSEAEANFARAMDAVETMLVRVSQKHLLNLPHFESVRRRLLEDALSFYQGFLARSGDAPDVRMQAARAHRSAGSIHRQLGQRDLASQELEKASDLLGPVTGAPERDLELAAVHRARATIAEDERRRSEAIEELRSALVLLARLRATQLEPRALRDRLLQEANAQSELAFQLSFAGRFAEARNSFRLARTTLNSLLAAEPKNEPFRSQLSALEHNEATLKILQGDRPAAVDHLSRAMRLQEELRRSAPDEVHYRRDQANSSIQLAYSLGLLGRLTEATEAGRRAIATFEQLVADYPSVPDYRYRLAAAHHNLAYAFWLMGQDW